MKRLLLPLCLLVACGSMPPDPPPHLTLRAALDLLPFQMFASSTDTQAPGMPLKAIWGVGSVTPQEVVDTLKLAGMNLKLENVEMIGAPTLPPPLPTTSPLRAELSATATGNSGEAYAFTVKLINTTTQTLNLTYGLDVLNAVIEDNTGKAVFWATQGIVPALAVLNACLPEQACDKELNLSVQLSQFQPKFPLLAGEYTLKVLVNSLEVSTGETSQELKFSLPPQKLTVRP
ncbi:hypothetical protein [Deinococcus rubellus]|uniref:DUF4832 domain-containing protein n=2 Tax=Deinococcus rubellus TaxID=1889240 RepID=A0ABY5YIZ9_9DEIO|nr:hypothetical protein [Deinococcus rubellus]UWX64768.1 hypothetical protein N0D28_03655 [Deinococcus rubellus]